MREIHCDRCNALITPANTSMVWHREQAASETHGHFDLCNNCDFAVMAVIHDSR